MATKLVITVGIVTGFGAYASIVNPDWAMGFIFGLTCCLDVLSVWLAVSMTENQREIDLIQAQLDVLKELKS